VNFGLTFGRFTTISVTELKEESSGTMRLLKRHRIRLHGVGAVIHSCSMTKNWIIFAHDPVKMDLVKMALAYSMDDWIEDDLSDSARTLYFVLPRHSSTLKSPSIVPDDGGINSVNKRSVAIYSSAPSFSYHDVAAFEHPSTGDIILDRIQYARKPPLLMESVEMSSSLGNVAGPGRLTRVTLRRPTCWGRQRDDSKNQRCPPISVQTLAASPSSCEMPVVSSRRKWKEPHRYVWSVDTARDVGPWTGICKSDILEGTCVTWRPSQERTFLGEPVFVSKREGKDLVCEDDGWLVVLAFHAAESRSSVFVLDAKYMQQVCRLRLAGFVPWSHHCTWTDKVFHQQNVARSKM
jgi:carotenoid cleavage dioxygenase-like enzyme